MKEYYQEGRYLIEADGSRSDTWNYAPKPSQRGTKPGLCQFEGCTELTIFGMCGPHQAEADRQLGEYLVKNGWTKVCGASDDLKVVGAEGETDGKLSRSSSGG